MRVIKRKKGKKEYFYLQHSFRRKKKVITREKYLGAKIPKDIDKIKEDFQREFKKDLYKTLEKIRKEFQENWKKVPDSIKEDAKEELSILFTYNTNAIEGSTITENEVREIIQDRIAPNKPLRDIKETEAHNKVFLKILKNKEKITNPLLLRWHKEIFGETKQDMAGKYRDYLVGVGSYIPPDWQEVRTLMNQLINFINKNKLKMNSVELAARAHYRFESIHPFGDGNGRIGRLLMNHILWHNEYPILIIEYKKRGSYYKALQSGEEGFLNYFLRRYLAAHYKKKGER